jgi:hypothetical protein
VLRQQGATEHRGERVVGIACRYPEHVRAHCARADSTCNDAGRGLFGSNSLNGPTEQLNGRFTSCGTSIVSRSARYWFCQKQERDSENDFRFEMNCRFGK